MTAPFYADKILSFELNKSGTDYVIGDVHGRFDLVEEALTLVHFNKKYDRLFCVGDLIDRGKESHRVLDFLRLPYVHAVRGNHEDILLELYDENNEDKGMPSKFKLGYYAQNIGLEWWLEVPEEKRKEIIAELKKLPLVMEVKTRRGQVGLIHADVMDNYSWGDFKAAVLLGDDTVITEALWGRSRLGYNINKQIEGIGRVYVGHTVQDKIKKLANVVAIDTGAVFNQHLTITNLACTTEAIIKAPEPVGNIQVIGSVTGLLNENKKIYETNNNPINSLSSPSKIKSKAANSNLSKKESKPSKKAAASLNPAPELEFKINTGNSDSSDPEHKIDSIELSDESLESRPFSIYKKSI